MCQMKGRWRKSAQCCSKNSSRSHSSSVSDLLPLGPALAIRAPRSNLPKACTKPLHRRSAPGASPLVAERQTIPSESASFSRPSGSSAGQSGKLEPVWRGHWKPSNRATATCNGWSDPLGCPLNSHWVGSLEKGFGNPCGYFSAATFCQYARSKGTFNRVTFVTFRAWSIFRTSVVNAPDTQKAHNAGKSSGALGTIAQQLQS